MPLLQQLNSSISLHLGDVWRRRWSSKSSNGRERSHENRSDVLTLQITARRQDECTDSCLHQSLTFVPPIANSPVMREDNPPSPTYLGEPHLILFVRPKNIIMNAHISACLLKRLGDLLLPETAIEEENERFRQP